MSRRRNSYKPAQTPADAETGAAAVRKFMINLFDREDGRAANWPLIADTLFRAAFAALDEVPENERTAHLLRRVHDGAYNRLVKNEAEDTAAPGEAAPPAAGAEAIRLPRQEFKR